MTTHDAVVVGAGPNGLTAAIVLARAGRSVAVFEAADEVGGGTRTAELTLDGVRHDVCAAIHPFHRSPPFASFPLAEHGLEWVYAPIELGHPLDGRKAVLLHHEVAKTVGRFPTDQQMYRRTIGHYAARADALFGDTMRPLLRVPRHPLLLARFGVPALLPATTSIRRFASEEARALFAGVAAHNMTSLGTPGSSAVAFALMAAAHAFRWPMAKGGSHAVTLALASYLRSLGGVIHTGHEISSLRELPRAAMTFLSVPPPALAAIAGDQLGESDRRRMQRWRFGPGVFKVDWALHEAIPWEDTDLQHAGTVHVGGSADEIIEAEAATWRGVHVERPFVLLAQPTLFDDSRAPAGIHTAWAYCHVPSGSDVDMTSAIESQVERFAPGFRDVIVARHTMSAQEYERYNPNYVGGDIGSGAFVLTQMLARPRLSPNPYRTPIEGVYLCGASTAPGAGVHGMGGWNAAHAALRHS